MRYFQCCLCPSLVDTLKHSCGYEIYSKEVIIPGFKRKKTKNDRVWFHLDCYYNYRLKKWGGEDPPRINGEPCIVRSEPQLLPVSEDERDFIAPKTEPKVSQTSISEILETDNITIVNRPLEVKDADSVSMSRYFEDVTMKEVEHVSDKAVYAIRRRFAHMLETRNQQEEEEHDEHPVEEKEEEKDDGKKYIGDEADDEEIIKNVKQIEGVDSNGKIILKDVDRGEE